eukprot:GAHX01000531.1.p1 GENE.GAHX01000531.1~~GAHX01000531.1.p1  ORF type:complete len:680 (-),score=127.25 GAHX01000531.1:36-2039(-)
MGGSTEQDLEGLKLRDLKRRSSSERRGSVANSTFLLKQRFRNTCISNEKHNLELAAIGNCNVYHLCDTQGTIVYGCMPKMDSDPMFNHLIHSTDCGPGVIDPSQTLFKIEIENYDYSNSHYFPQTAILVTNLYDKDGNSVRITDFCPLYEHYERVYNPATLIRMIKPTGRPKIKISLRISAKFGVNQPAKISLGPSHLLYTTDDESYRLTTSIAPVYIDLEKYFVVNKNLNMHLSTAEPVHDNINNMCRFYFEKTVAYWQQFTRSLFLPLEWQQEVIRAAITLKLCQNDKTGAVVAAMTTSIPESDDNKGRNWDYRYCWVRDSYHTIQSLNRLGQTSIMEKYLDYIINILHDRSGTGLQPLYSVSGEKVIEERVIGSLSGYRHFGPVRLGNAAYTQIQNDTYGSIILSVKQLFFDYRLKDKADHSLYKELENVGEMAFSAYNQADAGIWELRDSNHVHTHSSLMCWAACVSLAQISEIMKLPSRQQCWEARAEKIEKFIKDNAWSEKFQTYIAIVFDGSDEEQRKEKEDLTEENLPLDSSILLLGTLGLCDGKDERFIKTVKKVGDVLMKNNFLFRYNLADDFGKPKNSFIVCTFWYIEALVLIEKKEEARHMFENLLNFRNRFGILSEHIDIEKKELWGNFPQAYSMVGIINSALILSKSWDSIGL